MSPVFAVPPILPRRFDPADKLTRMQSGGGGGGTGQSDWGYNEKAEVFPLEARFRFLYANRDVRESRRTHWTTLPSMINETGTSRSNDDFLFLPYPRSNRRAVTLVVSRENLDLDGPRRARRLLLPACPTTDNAMT